MIYDRTNIVENFRGLIGFVPTHDNSNAAAKIDDSLKESESGQYINDLHSYFTAEIFSSVAGLFSNFTVISWSSSVTYRQRDVVMHNSGYYVALSANTNQPPQSSAAYWKKTTLLSQWIQQKYDGAVLATIDSLFEANKLDGHGKSLRGVTPLFDSDGPRTNTISKVAGRFVGYQINVSQANTSATLQRIGMQIYAEDGQDVNLPIYIRYNGQETVIDTLNFRSNSRFHYLDIPPVSFFGGLGVIEIGYYEDDLGEASAIGLDSDTFVEKPCYTCGGANTGYRSAWDKWIEVTPVSIIGDDVTDSASTNYGMNLTFSFRCDLSDILIREKISLVPALKAQLRIVFMEALASNVRNNKEADQVAVLTYNQLEDYKNPQSPHNVFSRAIKALQFEMGGINPACLPCQTKYKIRHGVV